MTATYPSQIRTFVGVKDFTSIVLAQHINDLYDEINAIETVLGALPQNDSSLTSATKAWLDLKTRLASLTENDQADAWHVFKATPQNLVAGLPDNNAITFTAPVTGPGSDTGGLWSGQGVKVKRAGWYDVSLWATFAGSNLNGYREAGIRLNNGWLAHETAGAIVDVNNPGLHMVVGISGVPMNVGNTLVPVARHGCAGTLTLDSARFSGHFVREL
jgi:hypothetical protein